MNVRTDRRTVILAALAVAVMMSGCAMNPATGKRQLSLYSERDEIQLGQSALPDIDRAMGTYDDPDLQAYVDKIGQRMASVSERPDLPWQFGIVDDTAVNAFALPGGFIFMTRGILAHFNSEAEMASVLGHEIGHVTARHSVEQMSRQQIAGIGLSLGQAISPEVAQFGGLLEAGVGLAFLKFGRDDENQSDTLGLRYLMRVGYDPREMVGMFETLDRISSSAGARAPEWQSTHPDPGNRKDRALRSIAAMEEELDDRLVNRDVYLDRIDGIVFGPNPREGYFEGQRFLHPDLAFRIDFPPNWKTMNTKSAVAAFSEPKDAMVQLTAGRAETPDAAAKAFAENSGVQSTQGSVWRGEIGGFPATSFGFTATGSNQTALKGAATFVDYGELVYQLLVLTPTAKWETYRTEMRATVESFSRLTDAAALAKQADRLKIVRLDRDMTVTEAAGRFGNIAKAKTLATLNGVAEDTRLAAGSRFKVIVPGS